mmetsp:Transcript_36861/g.63347  ORF Transcript_36861/g.63347 Transcript_36861/m.63347 type:complete len:121 (+) Transcript_36861:41-403(+)
MASMKMLRPKVLPKVLSQANTAGVKTTLLINSEGSLLAYAGADIGNDAVAAIVSNIWSSTEDNDQLEFIIMECEQGKVVVTKVSEVLLCLIGSEIAEFGMLKAKAISLQQYLEKPLSEVL